MLPLRLVFDLDDTLYLERDFARSGFAAAGGWLERTYGEGGLAPICEALLEGGRRGSIFNEALGLMGIEASEGLVANLVRIYRSHEPAIRLCPDVEQFLNARPAGFTAGMITDGPAATQYAKFRALELDAWIGKVVYTHALGPGFGKPSARPFEMLELWAPPDRFTLVYVADNPLKDFVTPRARGWRTIQIDREVKIHKVSAPDAAHAAHARIGTFAELDACLCRLGRAEDAILLDLHRSFA